VWQDVKLCLPGIIVMPGGVGEQFSCEAFSNISGALHFLALHIGGSEQFCYFSIRCALIEQAISQCNTS
jgi:hypothetical protein